MLLKKEHYGLKRYLFGALSARLGDEMSDQAILLVSLAATGSIVTGSSIVAGLTFSAALGGPLLGTLLDRSARRPGKVLAIALGLYAAGIAIIIASIGHAPLWASVTLALFAGFFMPAISGGWSSRLRSFITHREITRANTIDANTFNLAGLFGPALAGLVALAFGVYWAAAVLIALLVAALPMAWLLPKDRTQTTHKTSFTHDVASGFSAIRGNRSLFRITVVSAISYMGIGMLWVLYPLIGKELLGRAGYGGILSSVLSLSAVVATIAYAKWPTRHSPDTTVFLTTVVFALAMLLLCIARTAWVGLAAMLLAGIADGPQLAAIFAVRNRETPERLRSEVFTTGAGVKITAAAIGAEVAGLLAGHSLRMTLVVAMLTEVSAAVVFLLCSPKHSLGHNLTIQPQEA